jgi:hypothetical protein
MDPYAQLRLALANDRIAGLVRDAEQSRLARTSRPRRPRPSVQLWVGRTMIRIGALIAG